MTAPLLFDPGDRVPIELDWSDALEDSVELLIVTHTLPDPLEMLGETFTSTSSFVSIAGAVHGGLYMIEGRAELSVNNPDGSPQVLNRQFALRGWNS